MSAFATGAGAVFLVNDLSSVDDVVMTFCGTFAGVVERGCSSDVFVLVDDVVMTICGTFAGVVERGCSSDVFVLVDDVVMTFCGTFAGVVERGCSSDVFVLVDDVVMTICGTFPSVVKRSCTEASIVDVLALIVVASSCFCLFFSLPVISTILLHGRESLVDSLLVESPLLFHVGGGIGVLVRVVVVDVVVVDVVFVVAAVVDIIDGGLFGCKSDVLVATDTAVLVMPLALLVVM
jgi:hypothetical protein